MTQAAPYSWIKKVEHALARTQEIPLWGSPPPFPWQKFSAELAKQCEVKELKISHRKTEWLDQEQLLRGLGEKPHVLSVSLTPLLPPAFWVMSADDISQLTGALLAKEQAVKGFSDKSFKEGFYLFSCLKALHILQEIHAFSDLSPQLLESAPLPTDGGFAIDLSISLGKHHFTGRLICSEEFHSAFKQHFALHPPPLLSQELAKELEVTVHAEIGRTSVQLVEWSKVRIGDFVMLERCTFDPASERGGALIVLGETPLFQVRIKPSEVKILDYAFYQEEKQLMPGDRFDEPNEEDMLSSDEDEFLADETTLPGNTENHLWSSKNNNQEATEKLLSSKEIPLNLVAEIARVKISLEKLMQLKPGNILPFSVGPEHGIELTLNGRPVARGELIKLGELLGVKILKIGE